MPDRGWVPRSLIPRCQQIPRSRWNTRSRNPVHLPPTQRFNPRHFPRTFSADQRSRVVRLFAAMLSGVRPFAFGRLGCAQREHLLKHSATRRGEGRFVRGAARCMTSTARCSGVASTRSLSSARRGARGRVSFAAHDRPHRSGDHCRVDRCRQARRIGEGFSMLAPQVMPLASPSPILLRSGRSG